MANKIVPVSDYRIKSGDVFFFDNNIWMFIFCPIAGYKKENSQTPYSKFFEYALQSNAQIAINSLILSEFSHSCTRLAYNLYRSHPDNVQKAIDFKRDYVGCDDYKENVTNTLAQIKQILQVTTKFSDDFHVLHDKGIFDGFHDLGFNDCYYGEQAIKNSWIIVTDDRDFKKLPSKGITILTRN